MSGVQEEKWFKKSIFNGEEGATAPLVYFTLELVPFYSFICIQEYLFNLYTPANYCVCDSPCLYDKNNCSNSRAIQLVWITDKPSGALESAATASVFSLAA